MLVRVVEGNRIHARPGGGRASAVSPNRPCLKRGPFMPRRALFVLALFAAAIGASQPLLRSMAATHGQVVAPLPAGGASGLAARLFGEGLSRRSDVP